MIDLEWFNANAGFRKSKIFGQHWKFFNLFRRVNANMNIWGVGLLQIGNRHLFYIGSNAFSIFFLGKTK